MILEFQKTFAVIFGHQQLSWTSMLMWNCLEDLDSFKRLILDRFGADFEGWRGIRGKRRWAACNLLSFLLTFRPWSSRAKLSEDFIRFASRWDNKGFFLQFRFKFERPSLHTRLLLMCLWWLYYFNQKKHRKQSSNRNSWKASPNLGWKMFDLINPEYEVESQCRKGRWMRFFGVKKIPRQIVALETGNLSKIRRLVTLLKMEFEQKSHLAHRKARSWDHDATTQLEPKNNARRSSTISTVGVQIGWFWLAFSLSNGSCAFFFPKENRNAQFPDSLFHKKKGEHFANCFSGEIPKNSSDLLGWSLDLPQTFDTSAPWMYFYLRAPGVEPKAVVNHAGALFRAIFEDLGPFLLSPFRNTWNFFLSCKAYLNSWDIKDETCVLFSNFAQKITATTPSLSSVATVGP